MTILTKPFNEKKNDKLALPLFAGAPAASAPIPSVNGDTDSVIVERKRSATTLFLFLSAIAVMCMGILGGVAIYRLYAPTPIDRMRFHGFCGVPYDSQAISNAEMLQANNWMDESQSIDLDNRNAFRQIDDDIDKDFFHEEIDLDWSDEKSYAKITVPDFKDGRRGRFIHDFKQNQSGIIDNSARRCFIMPLDRETVLPPKSLYDLLIKMWNGYYNIDTERLRKNMRIVLPELTDLSVVSPVIANECEYMKVYLLEKYVSGVFKRNAVSSESGKFAEFSGNHIVEFDLVNIDEVEELENSKGV